jgi:spore maturation protein CgeB
MEDLKILILAHVTAGGYVRSTDNFVKTAVSRGACFLNHTDIYRQYGFRGAKKRISDFIEDNKINCVIYMPSTFEFYFDVDFFESIRKTCFTVMVSGEIETDYESRTSYYAQAMDLVLLPNFTSVAALSQIGVDSMPYWGWYHSGKYAPIGDTAKTMDVSFLGQLNEKYGRRELIDYLSRAGIHVETFGPDSKSGVVSEEEKIRIYRSTRINLNLAGVNRKTRLTGSREIHRRVKQFKTNLFEAAFCGGFVLSEYVPGMENLFEIGVEMDIFRDKEELAEKVKYYLSHDEERESAAKRGMERALKERRFDVEKAVPDLFVAIDERRRKKKYSPSEIYLDPEFITNYTSYRLWTASWFIKAGKWRFAFDELMVIIRRPAISMYQLRIFLIEEVLDEFPKIKAFLKSLGEHQ